MTADPIAIAALSQQQVACLRLVAELHTSKQIAERLGISSHTVDTHLSNAVRKLGARNRMEAARMLVAYAPPERLTDQLPPVATATILPSSDERQPESAPVGRQVALPRWTRLAIIVGGAVALVYAVVLIVVGAEVITRLSGKTGYPRTSEATLTPRGAPRES